MEPPIVIGNSSDLHNLIGELERVEHIAIDTESNSFYAYYERVCLIQISTVEKDYIIDPLVVEDIQPLKEVFLDPGIEKIFHAASNDITGLRRDFGFEVANLFDTALASKMLGRQHLGLAAILDHHFGVQLDKKWQRHNWGKRPLSEEQINYARLDTHYLIPLRIRLVEELTEKEIMAQAREMFGKACAQESQERVFQPEGFIRLSGARSLDSVGRRVLRSLYVYRDKEARRRDRAPFRIFPNEALVRLAAHRPSSIKEFARVKGLPRFYRKGRAAYELLEAIREVWENLEKPPSPVEVAAPDASVTLESRDSGKSPVMR